MKARVKETGEIVEVELISDEMYVEKIGEMSGRVFHIQELDFDNLADPDYWERLKHQYAGMAMQGILANIDLLMSLAKKKSDDYPVKYTVAEFAKDCAHALVEKMKNQSV